MTTTTAVRMHQCASGTGTDAGLISVSEACACAARYAKPSKRTETVSLQHAVGRSLAEPISARLAMPPFTQSAMDGYALMTGGRLEIGARLKVVDRIAAGRSGRKLSAGEAARVFTGAPLPEGSDAVMMQEHVSRDGDVVILHQTSCSGDNVRYKGEDIEPLEPLLQAGLSLDARHIALLAAQGVATVNVRARLRIAVISTGDELREAGDFLDCSTIYDSNRPMLLALVSQAGHQPIDGGWVPDAPGQIAEKLQTLAQEADLVISSGGASVGEEDHALSALRLAGGIGEVLKIALKPGKPAIVGEIASVPYLGLPGNPVSSLVTWLILGHAMITALEGRSPRTRLGYPMTCRSAFARRQGRTEFVPARIVSGSEDIGVEILGRGGSARLRPLVLADGLAEISAESAGVKPGDLVLFHPFYDGFRCS